jgi:hypothetical protein
MYVCIYRYLGPVGTKFLNPLVGDHGGLREHVGDQVRDLHAEGIVGIFRGILEGLGGKKHINIEYIYTYTYISTPSFVYIYYKCIYLVGIPLKVFIPRASLASLGGF